PARLFRALLSSEGCGPCAGCRDDRLWRGTDRHCWAGQYRGNAISSGKEPEARARSHRQFLEVDALILFPAIDLKQGECVRLIHGDMDQATVFNTDPAAQAKEFETQGFEYLHVVDLDGAFAGEP